MKDEPHRDLLDRDVPKEFAREHLGPALDLAEEVANYGSNLIPRCLSSSQGSLVEVVAIAVFGKHVVGMLDAVTVLVREGTCMPALLPMRSLIEASLSGEWVLRQDSDRRAVCFYV